jgi:predicted alpha/beta superfamily hydrolase
MKIRIDLILYFILILSVSDNAQQKKEEIVSGKTGDTYELIIRKPKIFDTTKSYHLVYFTDAGINSGKAILSQPEDNIKNCILVGIAHKGDWDTKRQRDFIPSDAGGYHDKDFGQASKFFLFMKDELVPYINRKFTRQKNKVFIGHSFGGLLALYMSLKENKLFDHYYAISPSVWASYYELMKIEKNYASKNKEYNSAISIYAGSLEFLNKVLTSSQEFCNTVKERNYKGLSITHTVISGVNHYGIVPEVIPAILKEFK